MDGIFISYRREDSAGWTGRIYDRLSARFIGERVFFDVEALRPGENFERTVEDILDRVDVLVAVIGPQWLDVRDASGRRRLDDPGDFVRREIVGALERGKMIIPVLVGGATMPPSSDVPEALRPLTTRIAVTVSDVRFDEDVGLLLDSIADDAISRELRRSTVHSNLPVQITSFIGRVQESAELAKLIRGSRLVTATGAGGCGKSRLALEVAAELVDEYPDGVWLVELASLSEERLVISALAETLGVRARFGTDTVDVISGYLSNNKALVVIDNCEHLIEPVARLVAGLLSRTTELRILATSREPLRVRGEAVYHLPTLAVPDENDDWDTLRSTDSVRLFAERAQTVRQDFRVTRENGDSVRNICRRLDGIPLAVEIAASAVRLLTPAQIEQRLGDTFKMAAVGARDGVGHHRTLEAAIDWSYQLLTPQQQETFARLAVFGGSFTLDAVGRICADDAISVPVLLDAVIHLANGSLLEIGERKAAIRYHMLETIRAFAADRLEELPSKARNEIGERHFLFHLSLAAEATEGPISTTALPAWLAELEAATPDLRKALGWAVDGGHDQHAVRLAGALGWYWLIGSRSEAVEWFEKVPLHSSDVDPTSRFHGLRFASYFLSGIGAGHAVDAPGALLAAEESLQLARELGSEELVAAALQAVGTIRFAFGDPQREAWLEEALIAAETIGNTWRRGWVLLLLALHRRDEGTVGEAKALFEEVVEVAREIGDDRLLGTGLAFLCGIDAREGDLLHARLLGEESLRIGRALNDYDVTGFSLGFLGDIHYLLGNLKTARSLHEQEAELKRRTTGREDMFALYRLGFTAYAAGDLIRAKKHLLESLIAYRGLEAPSTWTVLAARRAMWGSALVLAGQADFRKTSTLLAAIEADNGPPAPTGRTPWLADEQEQLSQLKMAAEAALDGNELREARERGAAMTLDESIDYVINLLGSSQLPPG